MHDKDKNTLFLAYVMAEAWEQAKKSPTLEKLCRQIIQYAKSVDSPAKGVPEAAATGLATVT